MNNLTSQAHIKLIREIKNSFCCDTKEAVKKARKWVNMANYHMKKEG